MTIPRSCLPRDWDTYSSGRFRMCGAWWVMCSSAAQASECFCTIVAWTEGGYSEYRRAHLPRLSPFCFRSPAPVLSPVGMRGMIPREIYTIPVAKPDTDGVLPARRICGLPESSLVSGCPLPPKECPILSKDCGKSDCACCFPHICPVYWFQQTEGGIGSCAPMVPE